MRCLIAGVEGGQFPTPVFQGEDQLIFNVMFLNDDGSIFNATGNTADLDFYTRADRSGGAALLTAALTAVTIASGLFSLTLTAAQTALLAKGTMYAFGRMIESGPLNIYANKPTIFNVN
jgi:hypothetical protein